MNEHKQSKTFECSDCGTTFVSQWRLRKHKRSHTDGLETRKCKFFNNGKVSPYEALGCKFLHIKAKMCKYAKACNMTMCQFRHY